MDVSRIGFTALKGTRHLAWDSVRLAPEGPVGDRELCLVDPESERVLRTVQNPGLVSAVARYDAGVLSVDLGDRTVEGTPSPTGEVVKADYWGRRTEVEVLDGPWAEAFSVHLGRDVLLARAAPGEVVYGASVTLLSTASLRLLGERLGAAVDSARFRATFVVRDDEPHTEPHPEPHTEPHTEPHPEDRWIGQELRLGEATVQVQGPVPRCAVVDIDPVTGRRDTPVLSTLAGYRREDGEVHFGVYAVVVGAGTVRTGDQVETGRG